MPPQTDFSPLEASTTFKECIKAILSFRQRSRFFLIFDAIERITFVTGAAEHWQRGSDFLEFWRSLRALFQENPELISFIGVGTNPKSIEDSKWQAQDNPIFNAFSVDYLQGFSYEQTVEMVQTLGGYMGLEFPPKLCTILHDDYGGHPYLMRHICSTIHRMVPRSRPTTVPHHIYEEARKDYEQQISPYIASIVDSLKEDYPIEYDMLLELAVGEYQTFIELASEEPRVLHHLLSYGLIEREGDRYRYRFRVQAVQRYLVRVRQFYRKADKLEEKWAEVSERGDRLEVGLRRMISLQLKARYGESAGKAKLLSALAGDRAKRLESMRFEEISNPTDSPLYFPDLYAVIKKEWSLFENFFSEDQHRIGIRLEHINKMRRDAHARSINEGDFVDLRRDFEVIEYDLRDLLY
jgi:hypothetical protein